MRIKMLLISIAWASTALANELPPELPFQAVDSGLAAHQEGIAVDPGVSVGNQNTNINPNQISEQMVNGTTEIQDQNHPSSEQATPSEPAQAPEPTPKPKKRPKILDKAPEPKKASAKDSAKDKEIDIGLQSGITIKPKPGRTESVVIAKGKLNRIVTPYADPKVLTVDNVETKIEGSAVYIATDSETPVSLFISDTETENTTSLQLTPQERLMPVEIRIEQDPSKASPTEAASSRTDRFFRQDSPYVTEIKAIMQNLGKQQIPQGFTLEEVTNELLSAGVCHAANLTFTPGQLLSGHDSRIVIVIAQNNGSAVRVFEEAYCAAENIMAVAAWPKVRLESGEKTEVFILMRLPEGKSGEEVRPALL
ncbi:TraK domain-containing protein [Methylobacter tundripaludum]|jgi:conjugal transfer pilus assembly protein TraK|uniref:TraK domain-containing protein n=2 Tax=Methylobacter tundripaludum TaxID=173365 RepID=UPI0009DE6232|nr:type-F conjugative transfer system secretin TraK [Methylobacter tundripaludum]